MKYVLIFLMVGAALFPSKLKAQADSHPAYELHSSNITVGYGIGNLWTIFLEKVYDIPDYSVKSYGPVTVIYEYAFLNRFSAGLAGSFSRVKGKAPRFQIADQITFLSLLLRANYHFRTNGRIDPYFGGGVGLNNSKYKNLDTHTILDNPNSNVPSTIDFSGQFGVKYFPFKNVGLNVEVGYISGAVALIGLTGKF